MHDEINHKPYFAMRIMDAQMTLIPTANFQSPLEVTNCYQLSDYLQVIVCLIFTGPLYIPMEGQRMYHYRLPVVPTPCKTQVCKSRSHSSFTCADICLQILDCVPYFSRSESLSVL